MVNLRGEKANIEIAELDGENAILKRSGLQKKGI